MCVVTCIATEKLHLVNMVLEAALNHTGLGLLGYLHHSLLCMYPLALQLSLHCAHSLRLCGDRVTLGCTARGCVVNLMCLHFIVL